MGVCPMFDRFLKGLEFALMRARQYTVGNVLRLKLADSRRYTFNIYVFIHSLWEVQCFSQVIVFPHSCKLC